MNQKKGAALKALVAEYLIEDKIGPKVISDYKSEMIPHHKDTFQADVAEQMLP